MSWRDCNNLWLNLSASELGAGWAPQLIETPEGNGSYGAFSAKLRKEAFAEPGVMRLDLDIEGAAIGVVLASYDTRAFLTREWRAAPGAGQSVFFEVGPDLGDTFFIIRNMEPGAKARVLVKAMAFKARRELGDGELADVDVHGLMAEA